eukprot:GEMP01007865.1.p1 GENE.GEMP01007865.1~~GEMP01007865.1.p1  ORF type:complete len:978 (+),score=167.00 GEMP01007865.1:79-2934(+)
MSSPTSDDQPVMRSRALEKVMVKLANFRKKHKNNIHGMLTTDLSFVGERRSLAILEANSAKKYTKSYTTDCSPELSFDAPLEGESNGSPMAIMKKPSTKAAQFLGAIRRLTEKRRRHSAFSTGALQSTKNSFIHGNLPVGVDLDLLNTQKELYMDPYVNAFIESGGEAQQQKSKARILNLMQKVALSNNANSRVQDPIFQMHDLLTVFQETTHGELRNYGEEQLQELESDLRVTVHKDIQVLIPSCKSLRRAELKARIKYGHDVSHLVDLNRASIMCPDMLTMVKATARCVEIFGVSTELGNPDTDVVDIADSWFTGPPMSANYRQIQLLLRFRGVIWEIQINTAPMLREKHDGGGHKYYVTTRYVQESILLAAVLGLGSQLREFFAHTGVRQVADCDQITDKNGLTALHHAAYRDDTDIGGTLLNQKANPWIVDDSKRLPIYYALCFHRTNMVELLAEWMLKKPPDELKQWTTLRPCLPYCKRMPESLATLLSAPSMATYLQKEYLTLVERGGGSEMLLLFRASKVPLDHEDRKLRFLIVLQELVETLGSAQGGVEMVAAFVLALAPGWDFDWHTQLMPLDPVSVQTFLVRLGEQLLLEEWHWQPRIRARTVKFAHNKLGTRSCGEALARILRRCQDTKEIDFKDCDLTPDFLQGFLDAYKPLPAEDNSRYKPQRTDVRLCLRSNKDLADTLLGDFLSLITPGTLVLFECGLSWEILTSITAEPQRARWCRAVTKLTLSYNSLGDVAELEGTFWTFLDALPQLEELQMNRCKLGPFAFAHCEDVPALRIQSHLKKLDISENPFLGTIEGGNALANIFQCCQCLEEINLSECDLGEAMVTLQEKMIRHESLTHLNMNTNPMLATFAKHVGRFLAFVPYAHFIFLDQCGWTLERFETFLAEPWQTRQLSSISLRGHTDFHENHEFALAPLLKHFRVKKCQNVCVEINMEQMG